MTAQRHGFEQLLPAQQWLLENVLGLKPAREDERPVRRTQDDKWNLNMAAARQYQAREGNLNVPRKHVETVEESAGQNADIRLGTFIDNTRRRAGKLTDERRQQLNALGMNW